MARVINYKDLFVWQKSVTLAKEVYGLFSKVDDERLKDLMAKTSISIASNIAEGNSRQISKEYRQFLYAALGDISQIDCQLILAKELGFITNEEYIPFEDKVIELRKMLYGLISKLKQRPLRPAGSRPGSSSYHDDDDDDKSEMVESSEESAALAD
ncbi:MAG: four helix bundle protein [Vampirovibrionia bacterium]